MLSVGHFVERFPNPELQYVYDQVRVTDSRSDRLLAGRLRQGALVDREPTVRVAARGRSGSTTSLRDRMLTRVAPSVERRLLGRFVEQEVRREPFAILHAHFGMAGAKVAPAAARLGIPLVTSFYGVDATACLQSTMWRQRYRDLFELGSLFVVLTADVVEPLVEAGCPRDRIVVWDLGIDFTQYPVVDRRPNPTAPRLLCVARFVEKKGHNLLIPAFARLRGDYPAATLTLMGYGPLLAAVQSDAVRHGVGDAVTFVDTAGRDDFYGIFRAALAGHDVFVLPCVIASNGDAEAGPPLTLVCAQASAMPVVTTAFVGSDRCVQDGDTAIVCDASAASVADGLARTLTDPGAARAMGVRASKLVRERMSLAGTLADLERHYEAVLERA
jgi:glycosyltransferase involved in cell wall biosynthesis